MTIDCDLMQLFYINHSIHEPWHSIFIFLYGILILTAFIFNSLVLYAVYRSCRRPEIDTIIRTRIILIGHLCTFDILLTFTMPWTAVDALTKFWPFGLETEIMCKFTKSASAAVVFSSSMMIIVIAIDSYRNIVYASGRQLTPSTIFKMTPVIIFLALSFSFPIFYHTRLILPEEVLGINNNTTSENKYTTDTTSQQQDISNTYKLATLQQEMSHTRVKSNSNPCNEIEDDGKDNWAHVVYCAEDWELGGHGHDSTTLNRVYYSLFSLTTQCLVPFFTISILYFMVYLKLRNLSVVRSSMMSLSAQEARKRDNKREKRTNRMLITISMVFCFCWLPLNLIGTLMDIDYTLFGESIDAMTIIFMSCHIVGMCSACINPVIYGFCNETIRKGNNKSYVISN